MMSEKSPWLSDRDQRGIRKTEEQAGKLLVPQGKNSYRSR